MKRVLILLLIAVAAGAFWFWRNQDRFFPKPVAQEVAPQGAAIRQQRALLEEMDPVRPLLDKVTAALRAAAQDARQRVEDARQRRPHRLGLRRTARLCTRRRRHRIFHRRLIPGNQRLYARRVCGRSKRDHTIDPRQHRRDA